MKYCPALCGLLTATSLLLPGRAAAESHLEQGKSNAKASATAHVDFRIVIPRVLSLGLADIDTQGAGAQRVAIFSNSRNVTLAASSSSTPAARNNLILGAAAGKVIERGAACRLPADASRKAAAATNRMICTVSMP